MTNRIVGRILKQLILSLSRMALMIRNQLHSSRLLIIRQITEKSIINRQREEERRTREENKF